MRRRDFLRNGLAAGVASGAFAALPRAARADGFVPAHNWDKFDFGSGPLIHDRLNQGPFPQYPPDAVIPATTSS